MCDKINNLFCFIILMLAVVAHIYLISFLTLCGFLWCGLKYTDNIHMFERCKRIGRILKPYIKKLNCYGFCKKYIFNQMYICAMMVHGFMESYIDKQLDYTLVRTQNLSNAEPKMVDTAITETPLIVENRLQNVLIGETTIVEDSIAIESIALEDNVAIEETTVVEDNIAIEETTVVEDNVAIEATTVVEDNIAIEETTVVEDNIAIEETVEEVNNVTTEPIIEMKHDIDVIVEATVENDSSVNEKSNVEDIVVTSVRTGKRRNKK
jgi:hypothetical protein